MLCLTEELFCDPSTAKTTAYCWSACNGVVMVEPRPATRVRPETTRNQVLESVC
jgi:hypothetical protein